MLFFLFFYAAFFLDLILGDPPCSFHPIRIIGLICSFVEKGAENSLKNRYLAGGVSAFLVIFIVVLLVFCVLRFAFSLSDTVGNSVCCLLLYTSFALRDLLQHSMAVKLALEKSGIQNARKKLSMFVGRDTTELGKEQICRAAVESVAENMVDGVTSVVFWAVTVGVVAHLSGGEPLPASVMGAFFYKAVNTMDSMFGYKNEKYRQFGFVAARLDDMLNIIPARTSGAVIILASLVCGFDWRGSMKIFLRDRKKHTSPNAGHPEAAFAGALNIRMGGASVYGGKEVKKPLIGDSLKKVDEIDIIRANKLAFVSAVMYLFFSTSFSFVFLVIL